MRNKFKLVSILSFSISSCLMIVPTVITYFGGMDSELFVVINLIALVIATLFITMTSAVTIATNASNTTLNDVGELNKKLTKWLFAIVILGQMVALMFVNI